MLEHRPNIFMILNTKINMTALALEQKNFKWDQYFCTQCNSKLWSHGFLIRYFSNFNIPLYFKRFRCCNCKIVFTIRPNSHWPRFQSSVEKIFNTIEYKFKNKKWPDGNRQLYNYWINRFISYYQMHFQTKPIMDVFQFLKASKQSFFA